MQLTPLMYLICLPLTFLAGLVDSIGGGGGLISLPAFLIAGVPVHLAIGTNKLQSSFGTAVSTGRFLRRGLIHGKLALPSVVAAVAGSAIGARLSLLAPEKVLALVLLAALPAAAFVVLNKNLFHPKEDESLEITPRICLTAAVIAFLLGIYDGFYGPGTGTFLILLLSIFAHLGIRTANGQTKAINLTTNITSLAVFLLNGQVILLLGLPCAACNMLGNYIGSGLMLKNGAKIVRPCIILVLILLAIRIITDYIA